MLQGMGTNFEETIYIREDIKIVEFIDPEYNIGTKFVGILFWT